jgi:outer membrane murein-binding lipoprotein Lpp
MASFTLSNQTTNTKMLLAIAAIASGVCMIGGIVMLLTPQTDEKEVEAIELNNEVRVLEEVVEQTLNKEQIHNVDEREQRIYEAKYAKAVEFLEQIENKEIEESKLIEKFSSDFKIIFLQAKRDMIIEGKIQDKSYDEELAKQLAHEQNEDLIVINKEISDDVLDKIDDSE